MKDKWDELYCKLINLPSKYAEDFNNGELAIIEENIQSAKKLLTFLCSSNIIPPNETYMIYPDSTVYFEWVFPNGNIHRVMVESPNEGTWMVSNQIKQGGLYTSEFKNILW